MGVRTAIIVSVVPGLLAAVAIVFAIRLAPKFAPRERKPLSIKVRPVLQGRLGGLMVGITAFELGNVAATLLILRTTQLIAPGHAYSRTAVLLYAGYNLAATLIAIPAGHLSDRRGAALVMAIAAVMFAGAFAGFAFAGASVALLACFFVLAGLGIGVGETAESAAIAAFAPAEIRGSAFGLVAAVQAFANLAASAVAGGLWKAVSPEAAFLYLAVWSILAAIAFAVSMRRG
jgi:MFS family permease